MTGKEQVTVFIVVLLSAGVLIVASATPSMTVVLAPGGFFILWSIYRSNLKRKKGEAVEFEQWKKDNVEGYESPTPTAEELNTKRKRKIATRVVIIVFATLFVAAIVYDKFKKPYRYVNPNYPELYENGK